MCEEGALDMVDKEAVLRSDGRVPHIKMEAPRESLDSQVATQRGLSTEVSQESLVGCEPRVQDLHGYAVPRTEACDGLAHLS